MSFWTPGNHPLRKAIGELFDKERLIAEPVFQSTFGWEPAEDDAWRKTLNRDVIERLEIGEVYSPYKHQAESWKALHGGNSIVVTSGTGSGKTECFMYPVLSDLYEQGQQNAIEAIFLYPLNALMEDQKKRLSNYCEATGLRFAVYNGETPEFRADGIGLPAEVRTRKDIRNTDNRPQILLTNPSMLEYILVRQRDQQMLQESNGKLRWIVIDEAHSYSGSAAVELRYQIKRILEAFGEQASDVRFACTSATIGGPEGEQSLIEFISDLTGQSEDKIKVIGGNRLVPELDKEELGRQLAGNDLARIDIDKVLSLRTKINEVSGMTLQQMWERLCPEEQFEESKALQLIDKLCEIKQDNKPVLSLRAHFFMRAIGGLYACANEKCPEHNTAVPQYGFITTNKATVCPHCGAPLLELVQCKRCNSFVLMGQSDAQTHIITQCEEGTYDKDYFSLDDDEQEEEDDERNNPGNRTTFYLLPYNRETSFSPKPSISPEPQTSDIVFDDTLSEFVLEERVSGEGKWIELQNANGHSYCPNCGKKTEIKERLAFKHFRIPISFINQNIAPVLLRESAPDEEHDWGKYIAFTDSRQGTAISAKTFNIDVERTVAREKLMKRLAQQTNTDRARLLAGVPEEYHAQILANITEGLSLAQLTDTIYDETIFSHYVHNDNADKRRAYKAALMRNFIGRRALYEGGVESMGLVTLDYTALHNVEAPQEDGFAIQDQDWRDFLKLSLDFFVRVGNHIQPLITYERDYVRDANLSTPIASHDDARQRPENTAHWPHVKTMNDGNVSDEQSRLVLLLCAGLGIHSIEDLRQNVDVVNGFLDDAWEVLVDEGILKEITDDRQGYTNPRYYRDGRYIGCYYLDLSGEEGNNTARIIRTESVSECPVTHQLLDTTFCGYSPMITGELSKRLCEKYKCSEERIIMPRRPQEDENVDEWMEQDDCIKNLKEKGFWSNRYKYTYRRRRAYLAAEHSAQQGRDLLREYTQAFAQENPTINVLHCSTTMEMGVDIGDIDVVLMDTVPPTAANYLQRVGRAGRAGQSKSVAYSLCNNTPVGQNAFDNPMWALQTVNHMPKVLKSQTIIQRHINSYFFRKFICEKGPGMAVTTTVQEFMPTLNPNNGSVCDAFINFLDEMSTDNSAEDNFHAVFGDEIAYTVNITIQCIEALKQRYVDEVNELEVAFNRYQDDRRRQIAISNQSQKLKNQNLLNYLSEHQFIPNANMPTGVVTFDFIDSEKSDRLRRLYDEIRELQDQIRNLPDGTERRNIEQNLSMQRNQVEKILRESHASRDVRTALNEYAPGQTVVVNEKNYVSAGITLLGDYNEETQTRGLYKCQECGKIDYSPNLQERRRCENCGESYHGILDPNHEFYTLAYEPVGFRTDQNVNGTREEKNDKHYFDIRPVLLNTQWTDAVKMNMCDLLPSPADGSILFYNKGMRYGFAFCNRCGRAALETSRGIDNNPIPLLHKRLWKEDATCGANQNDIKRHVVFTGIHPTSYTALRFRKNIDSEEYESDEQLAYSLGVVLCRALAKIEGFDIGEISFGVKKERVAQNAGTAIVLFIYDVAKGGCGYSQRLSDPEICQAVFDEARRQLEEADCNCHKDGGACIHCLIDRSSHRFANKLSKTKALEWLNLQKEQEAQIPENVAAARPQAKVVYQSLKTILRNAISNYETKFLTICASDMSGDCSVNDWHSIHHEMGNLLNNAVRNQIEVNIKIEYHPGLHGTLSSKLPFTNLDGKFADCSVEFVEDLGSLKTALIVESRDGHKSHYFVQDAEALSLSDNWGGDQTHVFQDNDEPAFRHQDAPQFIQEPSVVVREGLTTARSFKVEKYFTEVILPILQKEDVRLIQDILHGKNVNITFSDMYVNSALASLMLVYLIKEMKDLYGFSINSVLLQLDSPKRKCHNDNFNDWTYIYKNFGDVKEADNYTSQLFENVLEVEATFSGADAGHHRWLRFEPTDGGVVEIRPDHSISGGYHSRSQYMNLDVLNGKVHVTRHDEDVLYYVIIRKRN